MNNPFETDEDEWVEICDASGRRAAMRHLATLSVSGKTYFVLGAVGQDEDEPDGEEAGAEDDSILEMEDEDGQIIRFRQSATIGYQGDTYVLLSCEEAAGGFEQGESLIMLCTEDERGESCYQSLEDDALIEAVYDAYLKQTGGA